MMNLIKNLSKYRAFKKGTFTETVKELRNPQRGWFRLFTFVLEKEPDFSDERYSLSDDFSLALVLIDIGDYRTKPLDKEVFKRMERIIRYFREGKKDIILRVAYDHEGKGLEREPLTFGMVAEHSAQVAQFVSKHESDIFIYQGLLIGGWGEMHSSRYIAAERLRELYYIFESELKNKVFMAVRKPVQWRYLRLQSDEENLKVDGLGIFNDGMFGSDTDLGTFDGSNNKSRSWGEPWSRENETEFIAGIAKAAPCGGEALFGEGFVSRHNSDDYIRELRKQGTTYLNNRHDIKLMDYWKKQLYSGKGVWAGKDCFQYISAHLGYRFFIKSAKAFKKGTECDIKITVENQGFAPIYNDAKLYLEYEGADGRKTVEIQGSLKECQPDSEKEYSVIIRPVKGDICLYAKLERSGEKILFANEQVTEGGKYRIGTIK